jgi:hypothetical protein
MAIDQQGYDNLLKEATEYLTYLIYQLGNSYDELSQQDVDITDLGTAIDGIIFANERLKEQKTKLESYRNELKQPIISSYDQEEGTNGKA